VTDGSGQFLFTYWAPAASVLTSEVVTVTIGGTIFFANSMVFAINGSTNISSPFDSHGPQHSTAGAAVMATTASTAFVFSVISDSNNTGAAGASWTLISSAQFSVVQYQVSGAGTFTANITADTQGFASMIDALSNSGAADTLMSQIWM